MAGTAVTSFWSCFAASSVFSERPGGEEPEGEDRNHEGGEDRALAQVQIRERLGGAFTAPKSRRCASHSM